MSPRIGSPAHGTADGQRQTQARGAGMNKRDRELIGMTVRVSQVRWGRVTGDVGLWKVGGLQLAVWGEARFRLSSVHARLCTKETTRSHSVMTLLPPPHCDSKRFKNGINFDERILAPTTLRPVA
jgi:hypothetical protein